jgi:hypothetical protein
MLALFCFRPLSYPPPPLPFGSRMLGFARFPPLPFLGGVTNIRTWDSCLGRIKGVASVPLSFCSFLPCINRGPLQSGSPAWRQNTPIIEGVTCLVEFYVRPWNYSYTYFMKSCGSALVSVQCGLGSSILGQCGSGLRGLITKNLYNFLQL